MDSGSSQITEVATDVGIFKLKINAEGCWRITDPEDKLVAPNTPTGRKLIAAAEGSEHVCELPSLEGLYPGDVWTCPCGAGWEVDEVRTADDEYFDWTPRLSSGGTL
ncbi:MAG TPA: hypothetical protein VN039_15400 [Nitrospira sp.]|nr:hypothetical protein [Nitrospira sp.]